MSFNMIYGPVGAGKTMLAVHTMRTQVPTHTEKELPRIFTNDKHLKIPGYEMKYWRTFNDLKNARCGYVFIDEAAAFLDARKWESLPPSARRILIEHRKYHLQFIATTQRLEFVDKVYRLMMDTATYVKETKSYFNYTEHRPHSRPDLHCKHCDAIMKVGDTTKIDRLLGAATQYYWWSYKPDDLLQAMFKEPEPVASGSFLYSPEDAECYDTRHDITSDMDTADSERLTPQRTPFRIKP